MNNNATHSLNNNITQPINNNITQPINNNITQPSNDNITHTFNNNFNNQHNNNFNMNNNATHSLNNNVTQQSNDNITHPSNNNFNMNNNVTHSLNNIYNLSNKFANNNEIEMKGESESECECGSECESNLHTIFIAELTNEKTFLENKKNNNYEIEDEIDKLYKTYNFNNINLTYEEFINTFYNSNEGNFNIFNNLNPKLSILNQTYNDINGKKYNFNLTEAITRIYLEENKFFSMDANKLIEIEKEIINYNTLFDFNYNINSLDLCNIYTLLSLKKNIFTSTKKSLKIKIKIKVYYKSKISNIYCIMYFNYLVDIPGFKYKFIK
jgi:hypothetical protein